MPRAPISRRGRRIVVQRDDRRGQRVGIARRRDQAAAAFPRDHGRLGALIGRGDVRPAGGENAVDLARHDEPFEAALQRDDEHVGGRERVVQQRLRLIRKEADVLQAAFRRHPLEQRALRSVADDGDGQPLLRSQPIGRLDEHLEVLREPDVAGVHDDEAVGETVLARERVVLRPGDDRLAVGPVVDDVDARRVRAFFLDEPPPHPIAERDDRVGVPQQIAVDAIERRVHGAVLKVLDQHRDLRKDVLAEEHEARAGAPRRPQRRQPENRRIGQRDDDVGPADAEAGEHRGGEIAQVVRRSAGEAARATAACRSRGESRRRGGVRA